jgi:hypothetical protein
MYSSSKLPTAHPPSPGLNDWQSQRIAGILSIIFFGFIAIGYVMFYNTYFLKSSENLLESKYFGIPMAIVCILSAVIIWRIVGNDENSNVDNAMHPATTEKTDTKWGIIFILLALVIIVCIIVGINASGKQDKLIHIPIPPFGCIYNAFGLFSSLNIQSSCNKWLVWFDTPFISFLLPFIIFGLVLYLINVRKLSDEDPSKATSTFNYMISIIVFLAEYIYMGRYDSFGNMMNDDNKQEEKRFFQGISGRFFTLFYICCLIITFSIGIDDTLHERNNSLYFNTWAWPLIFLYLGYCAYIKNNTNK